MIISGNAAAALGQSVTTLPNCNAACCKAACQIRDIQWFWDNTGHHLFFRRLAPCLAGIRWHPHVIKGGVLEHEINDICIMILSLQQ